MTVATPVVALAGFAGCILGVLSHDVQLQGGPITVDGPWRFTAVTERLIRIEYDAADPARFVDEPTMAFVRSEPKGVWESMSKTHGGWSVLNTTGVSVRYQPDVPPSDGTVTIISRASATYKWTWGDDPADGNLRGTARTMDNGAESLDLNCHNKVSPTMPNSEMHCAWGLVSRKGWAVVNDTGMPIWADEWFAASRNSLDISVFMHGLDFAGALLDFFHASGPPSLPPRWALGTMFTRWFNFDSDSAQALVDDFESRSVPLDAWIFDMNWHIYGPWGAFSWNENSYPRLQAMLDWLQDRGLPVGANMHEHDGVSQKERTYKEISAALGRAPGQNIPFDLYNKTYAMAQEDIAIRALDTKDGKQGIDFSWIDYQQGETDKFQNTQIPNINPTIVLNMLRFTDKARHKENARGMILSRWGGLGNHRYPLGFSGDQNHDWKGLAYLPYFTSTAANVAFNYWSHDTVGGDGDLAFDYELTARWVQVSAWSPVLRFHDKGAGTGGCATNDQCARCVPWDLPNAFFMAVRRAVQERDALVPYIYTASWRTASTGLALTRPMYYEDPADEALYGLDGQYLFGPDMVISPITTPSGPDAKGFEQALGAVEWTLYAPESERGWVDRLNGDFHSGVLVSGTYGIYDVPGLVRQGAVIPLRPRARGASSLARARKPLAELEFRIMPAEAFYSGGSLSGSAEVVDDDGVTTAYLKGEQAVILCVYKFEGQSFSIHLSSGGSFEGQPKLVDIRLSFPQLPPMKASSPSLNGLSSTYDHELMGSVVVAKTVDLTSTPVLHVSIDPTYASALPNFVGVLGRIRRARYIKDALDKQNIHYGDNRANLTSYVLSATQMSPDFASSLPKLWDGAQAEVSSLLEGDADLKKDARRVKFVSMMHQDGSTQTHAPFEKALLV